MDILVWFDHKTAACEQRATQVDEELKFIYLDAARDNREARAAVAELIEAADSYAYVTARGCDRDVVARERKRLRAALARCGGAK